MKKVMYVIINQDLNMSQGKIGSHTSHAVFGYLLNKYDELNGEHGSYADFIDDFKNQGDTIVILKAHEKIC